MIAMGQDIPGLLMSLLSSETSKIALIKSHPAAMRGDSHDSHSEGGGGKAKEPTDKDAPHYTPAHSLAPHSNDDLDAILPGAHSCAQGRQAFV